MLKSMYHLVVTKDRPAITGFLCKRDTEKAFIEARKGLRKSADSRGAWMDGGKGKGLIAKHPLKLSEDRVNIRAKNGALSNLHAILAYYFDLHARKRQK